MRSIWAKASFLRTIPTPSVIATKRSSKLCRISASQARTSLKLESRTAKRRSYLCVQGGRWHTEPVYGGGIQTVSQVVGLQSTGWTFANRQRVYDCYPNPIIHDPPGPHGEKTFPTTFSLVQIDPSMLP